MCSYMHRGKIGSNTRKRIKSKGGVAFLPAGNEERDRVKRRRKEGGACASDRPPPNAVVLRRVFGLKLRGLRHREGSGGGFQLLLGGKKRGRCGGPGAQRGAHSQLLGTKHTQAAAPAFKKATAYTSTKNKQKKPSIHQIHCSHSSRVQDLGAPGS